MVNNIISNKEKITRSYLLLGTVGMIFSLHYPNFWKIVLWLITDVIVLGYVVVTYVTTLEQFQIQGLWLVQGWHFCMGM